LKRSVAPGSLVPLRFRTFAFIPINVGSPVFRLACIPDSTALAGH